MDGNQGVRPVVPPNILVGFRLRGLCCSLTQILPRSVCLPLTYLLALGSTAWRRLLLLFFRFPRADQFIAAKPVFWWGWAVIIVPIQGCSSQLYRQLTTYTYCVSQVFCVEQGGGENSPHQSWNGCSLKFSTKSEFFIIIFQTRKMACFSGKTLKSHFSSAENTEKKSLFILPHRADLKVPARSCSLKRTCRNLGLNTHMYTLSACMRSSDKSSSSTNK